MRHLLMRLLVLAGPLVAAPVLAQQLDLPRPSPNAKVIQTVGLTDITVDYSSPGVKGRAVWGQVVPWNQVWRAGANGPTKITFSKDVTISGSPVPAGSYSFFVIPKESGAWTAILNKDPSQAGVFGYKQDQDLLRLDVTPQAIPLRERLAFQILDFNNDSAGLALEWEKVRLTIPIALGTDAQVNTNLKALEDNAFAPSNQAAVYELDQKKDPTAALAWVEKSLRIKEDWQNDWTKARILAAKGQYKEAMALAEKAQKLGAKAPRFFAEDEVKKSLAEWKAKR